MVPSAMAAPASVGVESAGKVFSLSLECCSSCSLCHESSLSPSKSNRPSVDDQAVVPVIVVAAVDKVRSIFNRTCPLRRRTQSFTLECSIASSEVHPLEGHCVLWPCSSCFALYPLIIMAIYAMFPFVCAWADMAILSAQLSKSPTKKWSWTIWIVGFGMSLWVKKDEPHPVIAQSNFHEIERIVVVRLGSARAHDSPKLSSIRS